MYMTAIVLNAGLGDLTLGLKSAGFQVAAAYEADQMAMELHKANIDVPVFPLQPEKFEPTAIPGADLLAARLYSLQLSDFTKAHSHNSHGTDAFNFLNLLHVHRPKAFLLALNAASGKGRQLEPFLSQIAGMNFRYSFQLVDIAGIAGTPTAERMVFVAGSRSDIYEDFRFPRPERTGILPLEEYLQPEDQVDPWYFASLKPDRIPIERDMSRIYCWKKDHYVGTDCIRWNSWKIPLVDTGKALRKMTHREIANLKGFPADYDLPAHASKSRLYQKLMYAVNVQAAAKLAEEAARSMAERPQWSSGINKFKRFEDLFSRYLSALAAREGVNYPISAQEREFDFVLDLPDQKLYIELKYYRSRFIASARLRPLCVLLGKLPRDSEALLVLTSEVSEDVKQEYLEGFHVHIWDIKNLLWLFGEFEEIKNEFVALLDYTTGDIEPVPPGFTLCFSTPKNVPADEPAALEPSPEPSAKADYEEADKARSETADWKKRLSRIEPGKEQPREYERFCVDILKYILGDYLSLWEEQDQTNDGLHRFDLCCKIKNGVNQDFFDTIAHYFKTKYIVFEFKNYSKEISQKEIYTTEKYLYGTALRKVAIIISRLGGDGHALQAAKGSLRENGKLILCLSDQDLLKMAEIKARGDREPTEYLSDMLDRLLVHLEK